MMDLLSESVKLVNLPYTILLGLICLYWVLYLIGAIGSDALDFMGLDLDADADVDVDMDVDADVDADIDAGSQGGGSTLASALQFFHVGELPVVVIFSILITTMWAISVLTNYFLGNDIVWVAMLLFIPILVVGLMMTKAIVMPFAPYLKQVLDQSSDKIEVVGKSCKIVSAEATPEYGQAEFATSGSPLLLNVRTEEGVTLARGEEAIVYGYDQPSNTYLVARFDISAAPKSEE
jgi:hypothetical protein